MRLMLLAKETQGEITKFKLHRTFFQPYIVTQPLEYQN